MSKSAQLLYGPVLVGGGNVDCGGCATPAYVKIFETSTGPYRSCAALKDISIPLKYLVEFSFVWFGRFWFGLVGMV